MSVNDPRGTKHCIRAPEETTGSCFYAAIFFFLDPLQSSLRLQLGSLSWFSSWCQRFPVCPQGLNHHVGTKQSSFVGLWGSEVCV